MRKFGILFLTAILFLFFMPFGQTSTNAASNVFDKVKDGEYNIIAKAVNEKTNDPSGAASFIKEEAKLVVQNGEYQLTLTIPQNDVAFIAGMQIENREPVIKDEQWTYTLSELKNELKAQVQYEVPSMNMKHDVPFRFLLEGLEGLPVEEKTSETEEEAAEESVSDEKGIALENGYYKVKASYLHASKEEPSSMGRYLSESLFLYAESDTLELTIVVNDHDTVTALKIDGKNAVSTKLDGKKRIETFKLPNTNEALSAYVEYEAPFNGTVHKGNANFRVAFDAKDLEKTTADEQPGKEISANYLNLADGLYAVNASFINAKNGENSAMARYLGEKAYISVQDGKAEIYFAINDNKTVTKLKVNDQEKLNELINGNVSLQSFIIDPLLTELTGYAEYEAPFNGGIHKGNAQFNVLLDAATIKEVKELPIEHEKPKDEGKEETPEKEEKPKEEKPKEEASSAVQGYTIQYVIKHATEDDLSSADNFFVKPAILLKKDGKNYLQITIKSWHMIESLKVNNKAVTIVEENKEADTALVQFEIPSDLDRIIPVQMKVTVPGLYSTEHEARLVLDAQSLVEKDGKEYVVHVPSTNEKNEIEKPTFDNNEVVEETKDEKVESKSNVVNPQTGDASKIGFFATLLISSLALLVVQYRRRVTN